MSKFKPADTVRIVKKVEKAEGWQDEWVPEMDQFINQKGTILKVRKDGSYDVKVSTISLNFHETSLKESAIFKVGDKVRFVEAVTMVNGWGTDFPTTQAKALIGKVGVINQMKDSHQFPPGDMVYVRFPGFGNYYFHINCLEHVKE